jgi:hypothetical protein
MGDAFLMSRTSLVARHVLYSTSLFVSQRESEFYGIGFRYCVLRRRDGSSSYTGAIQYSSLTRLAGFRQFDMLDLPFDIFFLEHASDSDASSLLVEVV